MYLNDKKLLQLPAFQPADGCSVPPYPVKSLLGAVAGVVSGRLLVCGGKTKKL